MRVLRPGGIAVFSENSGSNPVLTLARRVYGDFGIPKWSSPDEHPLTREEVRTFGSAFDRHDVLDPEFTCFQLADAKFFQFRNRGVTAVCRAIDSSLVWLFPLLRPYSYRQVVVGRKVGVGSVSSPAG